MIKQFFRKWCVLLAMGIFLLPGGGCLFSSKPPETSLQGPLVKLSEKGFPAFGDTLTNPDLVQALEQSIHYYGKIPGDRMFKLGENRYPASHMKHSLEFFLEFIQKKPSSDELTLFIRNYFDVFQSQGRNKKGEVLFTGYYEPSLLGSLTHDEEKYPVPLYSFPRDLVRVNLSLFSAKYKAEPMLTARVTGDNQVLPYFTRAEINGRKDFYLQAEPIAWVSSLTDRFFLEIQGSGRVELDNGDLLRVHYDGKNGHPYRSIGRYLIDQGEIPREKMSMQAIRAWLQANPRRQEEVFHHNPSFVFFRKEKGGPFGSIGVPLTPIRSIATDRSVFPRGALCFVETSMPPQDSLESATDQWSRVSGFVLNQDTGGAIKGPGRVDFFFGHGPWAEFAAGHLNHSGSIYVLVMKK
jgi:membrane-bound lytic murein transglycosylase A